MLILGNIKYLFSEMSFRTHYVHIANALENQFEVLAFYATTSDGQINELGESRGKFQDLKEELT